MALELGRFVLADLLSSGGQGRVWRAHDRDLGTPVAVKVLHPRFASEARMRTLFGTEVRAVARLDHPNIVLVFDHGVVPRELAEASRGALAAGSPWLAMELVSGGDLLERGNAPASLPDTLRLLRTLLAALAHAHARGVLHLDLKPTNVLLAGPGDLRTGIRVVDFGIARVDGAGVHGVTMGSPGYSPPEQLQVDGALGPWTDLYALGRMAARWPGGAALAGWLARCVAEEPGQRFQSAAAALAALPEPEPERLAPVTVPVEVRVLGLAMFALRTPRLVGRADELARLEALRTAALERRRRELVVVRGPRGSGRSALVGRFLEHCREHDLAGVDVVDDADLQAEPDTMWCAGAGIVVAVVVDQLPVVWGRPTAVITLPPLPDIALHSAVREWLPLAPTAVAEVLAQANGLPGRARELVAGWVASGRLRRSAAGLVVAPAHDRADRTRPVLRGDGQRALELLAAFGGPVPLARWLRAAAALGLEPDVVEDGLERCIDFGLLAELAGEVRFVREDDAEDVADGIAPARRAAVFAAARDATAADLGPDGVWRAPFLVEAGDVEGAATLLEADLVRVSSDRDRSRSDVLSRARSAVRLLRRAGVPEVHVAHLNLLRGELWALVGLGAMDAAERSAERLCALALPTGRVNVPTDACYWVGDGWYHLDPARSLAWLERAFALAPDASRRIQAGSLLAQGYVATDRIEEGDALAASLLAEPDAAAVPYHRSLLEYGRGFAAHRRGDLGTARAWYLRSLEGVDGSPPALTGLADLLKAEGRYDDARRVYRDVLDRSRDFGNRWLAWFNLALVELEVDRLEACRARIRESVDQEGPPPDRLRVPYDLLLAACAAYDRDWAVFAAHFDRVATHLPGRSLYLNEEFGGVVAKLHTWTLAAPAPIPQRVDALVDVFREAGVPVR